MQHVVPWLQSDLGLALVYNHTDPGMASRDKGARLGVLDSSIFGGRASSTCSGGLC